MDVTKILEADHRKVEALFDQIEDANGPERQHMIDELVTSLRGHMELEETVVYPAMEPVTGEEAVEEGYKEHELARDGLAQMIELAPDEPGFGAALDAVKAGISHHVQRRRRRDLPETAQGRVHRPRRHGDTFMQKRVELGMPIEADALAAASSKSELVEEAKSAGVDAAASMTKAELTEALAARMS